MVKSKKILSLALAVVMVLSMLTVGAFAAATTPTGTFTVSSSASEVANGDVITITVKANATEDFYAGPMSLPIKYDASLFEYVADSATVADIYGAGATKSVVKSDAGMLTAVLTPSTSGTVTAPNLNGANLTVLTFQLKAIGSTGSSAIEIADDQKTASNISGKFYCGSFDGSNPKADELTAIGQTLNRVGTTVAYAAAGTPELILTETGTEAGTVIDRTTTCNDYAGYVYGVDTLGDGADILDYVTTNVGSVEVVENDNGVVSTGATIVLKDAAGEIIETYVFVYFGDVNGDGMVDLDDSGLIEAKESYLVDIEEGTAQYIASDLTCDTVVDLDDSGLIDAQEAYLSELPTQYELAQTYAANNL